MSSSRLYRTIPRTCLRQPIKPIPAPSIAQRRLLSTAPPAQKSRSWKSSAIRWGLAVGGIYYYNTSNLFAEEAAFPISQAPPDDEPLPTLESLSKPKLTHPHVAQTTTAVDPLTPSPSLSPPETPLSETQEEAGQQGAFNEETGEINWDCPCLGGMANGPCGEEFRAAFSCFVYSKEEPKGMECIDRFKNMQNCFRDHPDVYGAELEAEDEEYEPESMDGSISGDVGSEATPAYANARTSAVSGDSPPNGVPEPSNPAPSTATDRAKTTAEQVRSIQEPESETDDLVPKAAFDATGAPSKGEK